MLTWGITSKGRVAVAGHKNTHGLAPINPSSTFHSQNLLARGAKCSLRVAQTPASSTDSFSL